VVLEYAAPMLEAGGTAVLWRGRPDPQAEVEGEVAARELGLALDDVVQVLPYPRAQQRYLYLYSKVRETPSRYPRRAGVALKRPLGTHSGSDRPRR
jgi:16S rRNA (guanine527-N7)-methyltransferase